MLRYEALRPFSYILMVSTDQETDMNARMPSDSLLTVSMNVDGIALMI